MCIRLPPRLKQCREPSHKFTGCLDQARHRPAEIHLSGRLITRNAILEERSESES